MGHRVLLAVPGPSFTFGAVCGMFSASLGNAHTVNLANSGNGWDDFNILWTQGLNKAEAGEITHFAMLHSDIAPEPGWLDTLLAEMDARDAHLVSAIAPIKDPRGLTSSGIGIPTWPWNPYRRFTIRELESLPETFDQSEIGAAGYVLLHNTGCWVCDLRKPEFFATREDGSLRAHFDFPRRVYRSEKHGWQNSAESEDWFFSRQLHDLGARTFITRKVKLTHRGPFDYENTGNWGTLAHDDQLAEIWPHTQAPQELAPTAS